MSEESSRTRRLAGNLRGILIPFVTPFDERGEVDARALGANLEKWNETGVSGYVALGSTGERVHLSERECLMVIEEARARVPSSLSLIAGAGQQSTRLTVEEVRLWAGAGADALLVITPGYYRPQMTQGALTDYYRRVADAAPVPVLLYNIPQVTGVTLAPETVARLASHENICGIKDSSGDMVALGEMLRLVPESFSVLTGHGSALLAALSVGARGGILAIGCLAPRACVEIYGAFHAGEIELARSLQQRVSRLVRTVMGPYGIGGIKAAMDLLGYAGRHVRAPLQSPDEAVSKEIAELLKASALFDDETGDIKDGQRLAQGAK
jgi:4-hydroxy-2-oxoglutarate aldolase